MTLEDFLKKSSISQRVFGESLAPSVSQGQVSQWLRGRTRITLHYALQIQRITKRKVTINDCAKLFSEKQSVVAHRGKIKQIHSLKNSKSVNPGS